MLALAFVGALFAPSGIVESSASKPALYSASRWAYCLGDPAWSYSSEPGWWLVNLSSTGWTRDATTSVAQRIYFDDSVPVMQSVSGSYGHTGTSGPCRTAAVRIDGSDPPLSYVVNGAQGAVLRPTPNAYTNPDFWGPAPTAIPQQGETWWYGHAFKTNADYVPYGWRTTDLAFGNWNSVGLNLHGTDIAPLGPIVQEVATTGSRSRGAARRRCSRSARSSTTRSPGRSRPKPARCRRPSRHSGPNGSVVQTCNQTQVKLAQPRLQIALTAGLNDATVDDGVHTCRRILGPVFQAGTLYKVIYQVKWDAFQQGEFRWWVDSGDGRGYVQYAEQTGVSTLWRSGSTPDTGTYPQLVNYRKTDTSLPPAIMYYGGFVRGSTMADVAIP